MSPHRGTNVEATQIPNSEKSKINALRVSLETTLEGLSAYYSNEKISIEYEIKVNPDESPELIVTINGVQGRSMADPQLAGEITQKIIQVVLTINQDFETDIQYTLHMSSKAKLH